MDGSTERIPLHRITEEEEKFLVKKFEWRFPRSESRPCESVSAYPIEQYSAPEEWANEESDDEVDLLLARELDRKFGFPGVFV